MPRAPRPSRAVLGRPADAQGQSPTPSTQRSSRRRASEPWGLLRQGPRLTWAPKGGEGLLGVGLDGLGGSLPQVKAQLVGREGQGDGPMSESRWTALPTWRSQNQSALDLAQRRKDAKAQRGVQVECPLVQPAHEARDARLDDGSAAVDEEIEAPRACTWGWDNSCQNRTGPRWQGTMEETPTTDMARYLHEHLTSELWASRVQNANRRLHVVEAVRGQHPEGIVTRSGLREVAPGVSWTDLRRWDRWYRERKGEPWERMLDHRVPLPVWETPEALRNTVVALGHQDHQPPSGRFGARRLRRTGPMPA